MIAHKMDLFLLHDTTTAMIVPNPTGAMYTGRVYAASVELEVQPVTSRMRRKSDCQVMGFMIFLYLNLWYFLNGWSDDPV